MQKHKKAYILQHNENVDDVDKNKKEWKNNTEK
jgi:hypothetical protein